MFIDTPQNTLKIHELPDGRTNDGMHYLLRMRRDASLFFLNNREAVPSEENYAEAAQFMSNITGLSINGDQAAAILSLYPRARIKIAVYDGIGDTDVRDDISEAVAHFFLSCSWPTYGDDVDLDQFLALLQKQAVLMGYQITPSND